MQWHLPLMHSLAARYLGTTQSTSTTDFNSLSPRLNGAKNCLFHSPPVSNTALNLLSYHPSYQISVKLRLPNLLYIQLNTLPNKVPKEAPHFINSLSSPSNDDTRPGSMDGYRHLICLAVNLY